MGTEVGMERNGSRHTVCDEVLAANPIVSDVVLCTSTSSRLARLVERRQRVFVTRTVHCSTGSALLFGKPQRTP